MPHRSHEQSLFHDPTCVNYDNSRFTSCTYQGQSSRDHFCNSESQVYHSFRENQPLLKKILSFHVCNRAVAQHSRPRRKLASGHVHSGLTTTTRRNANVPTCMAVCIISHRTVARLRTNRALRSRRQSSEACLRVGCAIRVHKAEHDIVPTMVYPSFQVFIIWLRSISFVSSLPTRSQPTAKMRNGMLVYLGYDLFLICSPGCQSFK